MRSYNVHWSSHTLASYLLLERSGALRVKPGMESKDRRQTAGAVPLGTVSPSVLNARKSLGLPRATKESKLGRKTGLISRPSLAGKLTATAGQPQRRSSTYGNSSGVKTDPRPVSDKVYQQKLVRTLIQFLTEHGYQHPISPKLLTSPMAKDVTAIAQFLHSQADPHFKKFTKLELDVPELFKNLRYPFGISKSALFAVGSPHTWPGLLAALLWLVELLSYQEKAEEARPETFDEKQAAEHDFYEYIEAAYKAFLSGDDAQAQELDDSKMQQFEERASSIDQESNQLQQVRSGPVWANFQPGTEYIYTIYSGMLGQVNFHRLSNA